MSSNSQQMTIEEKVIQKIKSDSLMQIIEDEDSLTELAVRAVKEAFFNERTVPDGSWSTKRVTSPVVNAASKLANSMAERAVKALLEDPEMKARVQELIIQLLPAAILGMLDTNLRYAVQSESQTRINAFINDVRNKSIIL